MLKGSLVLGTLILLSTPLKSDGYGRCESCTPCSDGHCPSVTCHSLLTSADALGFQCLCSKLGSWLKSDCQCEDIEPCTEFYSEIRNQCTRDLNCSRAMGSYTCVCFFPADVRVTMVVSPSATPSTLHLVAPKSTVIKESMHSVSNSESSRTGEVVGVMLGTVTVVISVVLTTTAAIFAVFRYHKKRATETLAPWPEPRRCERDIHNPTYGSKELPPRVIQAIVPPVYEELDSPVNYDTNPADRIFSKPLYSVAIASDYAYEPIDLCQSHSDASPCPNNDSDQYVYAYPRTQDCQSDDDCSSKPSHFKHLCPDEICEAQILDDNDTRDYSQLDPNTQYASLEPYTGSTADTPKDNTTETAAEKESNTDDYSHLQH